MSSLHRALLEILKNSENSLKKEQLLEQLSCTAEELDLALEQLQRGYRVRKDQEYYSSMENDTLKVGTLSVTSQGNGFVSVEGMKDIYISKEHLKGCIHNDLVLVQINPNGSDRLEGKISKRLARGVTSMVGEVVSSKKGFLLVPEDSRYHMRIKLKNVNVGALEGDKVVFKLVGESKKNNYEGQVIEILGNKNDPGMDVLVLARSFDVEDRWPEEVLEEVKQIPDHVLEEEMDSRVDLRDELIFTIDGDHSKDFDDAISLRRLENGNYELGVHIADVSHYVKKDSALDQEALKRGNSNYLIDHVIPMLPHELSSGICSLKEDVDRLTRSFVMEYSPSMDLVSYRTFLSVIHSKKRMTYRHVNEILEQGKIPEGYEGFEEKLVEMQAFAHLLRKEREKRGATDFDLAEPLIDVNEKGVPRRIIKFERGEAEKLIEDFMIAANEAAAMDMEQRELPFLYRVHENPSEKKMEDVLSVFAQVGYYVKKSGQDYHDPKTMQAILEGLKRREDYKVLAKRMLRTMKKAQYSSKNIGHFGLASQSYAHMTSPIRRYSDLENHRILMELEKSNEKEVLEQFETLVRDLAFHLSSREQISQKLEREVSRMKAAEYMRSHIHQEYEGVVSDLSSKGMYVQLPNLIEGKVSFQNMNGTFTFDEKSYTIKSLNSDLVYRLGSKVTVVVLDASKQKRTIEFGIKGTPLVKRKKER